LRGVLSQPTSKRPVFVLFCYLVGQAGVEPAILAEADLKFCPHFGGENALFEQQTRLFWASLGTSLLLTIAETVRMRRATALAPGPRNEAQRDTMPPTGGMADAADSAPIRITSGGGTHAAACGCFARSRFCHYSEWNLVSQRRARPVLAGSGPSGLLKVASSWVERLPAPSAGAS